MSSDNTQRIEANARLLQTVLAALTTTFGEGAAARMVRKAISHGVTAVGAGRDYHAALDNALGDLVNEYDIRLCQCGEDCNRSDSGNGYSWDCMEAAAARAYSTAD